MLVNIGFFYIPLHLLISSIKYMRKGEITHLPSSSFRSYSSVKRVDVAIALDVGVLFRTAAILLVGVMGDDTLISLVFVILVLVVLT